MRKRGLAALSIEGMESAVRLYVRLHAGDPDCRSIGHGRLLPQGGAGSDIRPPRGVALDRPGNPCGKRQPVGLVGNVVRFVLGVVVSATRSRYFNRS